MPNPTPLRHRHKLPRGVLEAIELITVKLIGRCDAVIVDWKVEGTTHSPERRSPSIVNEQITRGRMLTMLAIVMDM